MDRRPWFSISSLRIGRNLPRFKSRRQFLRRTVCGELLILGKSVIRHTQGTKRLMLYAGFYQLSDSVIIQI